MARSKTFKQREIVHENLLRSCSLDESRSSAIVDSSYKLTHHHERFLRGIAASKSLSRRRRLHHRSRIHHSDWFGGVSGLGIAKLDFASCGRAFAGRFSGRADSGLGLRCNASRDSGHARFAGTHRRRNIIALTAIGLAISAVAGFFLFPRASGRIVEKSIAVLPFQSLSDEKENAYFADGIQDDILTNLSKIGELKVISRMSVMSYRGDGLRNAREIGKALGVGALLEGSVRRAGNRVRVSVQLIDANNDEHIWAEDYDRDLTDVFAIQTDLAQKIASALQAKLSPDEKERLDRQPTKDPNAHLLFIQAHDYANRQGISVTTR